MAKRTHDKDKNDANPKTNLRESQLTGAAEGVQRVTESDDEVQASARELADTLAIELTEPMSLGEIQRLLKPLPGCVAVVTLAADKLAKDAAALNFQTLTSEAVRAAGERQQRLQALEAAVTLVQRAVVEHRMRADDEAMQLVFKLGRRVSNVAEERPELAARWRFLTDFISAFRPGPTAKREERGGERRAARPANPSPAKPASPRSGPSDEPSDNG